MTRDELERMRIQDPLDWKPEPESKGQGGLTLEDLKNFEQKKVSVALKSATVEQLREELLNRGFRKVVLE